MADQDGAEALQFDRVVAGPETATPAHTIAVTCALCKTTIETEYYDINGKVVCSQCRAAVESAAQTPRGATPVLIAGLFGLGAGIAGAAIYYAVIAIAHLEIGIVAILIGYMVGYAVRKGAGGRGGRRFQILAVALTYASIALAYTPLAVKSVLPDLRTDQTASAGATGAGAAIDGTPGPNEPGGVTLASGGHQFLLLAFLAGWILALPVLVIVGSLPMGLISAFIIFIGMRQAWRMTGAPTFEILGPYRVGAPLKPAAS